MSKYHINPETGHVGICSAKIMCRFNLSDNEHYNTEEEARKAYEESQMEELFPTKSKNNISFQSIAYINQHAPKASQESVNEVAEVFQMSNLDEYAHEIEFPNYSSESSEEYLTFSDLKENPSLAGGNCFAVSSAIEEELGYDFKSEGIELTSFEIKYKDGFGHTANKAVLSNGEIVIIDYTANQYDETLPMPYVSSMKDWAETINDRVNKKHGTEISEDSLTELF